MLGKLIILGGIAVCIYVGLGFTGDDILNIAKRVGIKDLSCLESSQELVKEYTDKGYKAVVKTGWVKDDLYLEHVNDIETDKIKDLDGHAWVEVCRPVEATTGEYINPNKVKEL